MVRSRTKFTELLLLFMGIFEKCPPPSRVAQASQIAAQKTPWLGHLHLRLPGNIAFNPPILRGVRNSLGSVCNVHSVSPSTKHLYEVHCLLHFGVNCMWNSTWGKCHCGSAVNAYSAGWFRLATSVHVSEAYVKICRDLYNIRQLLGSVWPSQVPCGSHRRIHCRSVSETAR
jgi:hypothetical protein